MQMDGHYGHGKKITVLFAIEPGDPGLAPQVYGSVENGGGFGAFGRRG